MKTTAQIISAVLLSLVVCQAQPTPTNARPNILFAIADDWSAGHAGAYGCLWVKTPAFDRVAKQGLLFTRAYTPRATCSTTIRLPPKACAASTSAANAARS